MRVFCGYTWRRDVHRERNQPPKILQDVIERNLRPGQAAEILASRHVIAAVCWSVIASPGRWYEQSESRSHWQPSVAQITDDLALSIIRERYRDFGPTLARKNWRKFTVWSWARKPSDALYKSRTLDPPKTTRTENSSAPYRRPCTGVLIQIDGCDHYWLKTGVGPVRHWSMSTMPPVVYAPAVCEIWVHLYLFWSDPWYIEKYGKPMILYSDKASVFRSIINMPPPVQVKRSLPGPCVP